MVIYEHIGSQIRKLREESRLSQEALAKEIGVSANTISRWETATYKLSINDLEKLASFFEVGLAALLPQEELRGQMALYYVTYVYQGEQRPYFGYMVVSEERPIGVGVIREWADLVRGLKTPHQNVTILSWQKIAG